MVISSTVTVNLNHIACHSHVDEAIVTNLLPCSGTGAEYCDQPVCLCLSLREHISGTTVPIHTKFVVQIPCGRGSVLLQWHCAMLCTSGFMDDITFGRNGHDAE